MRCARSGADTRWWNAGGPALGLLAMTTLVTGNWPVLVEVSTVLAAFFVALIVAVFAIGFVLACIRRIRGSQRYRISEL